MLLVPFSIQFSDYDTTSEIKPSYQNMVLYKFLLHLHKPV